MFEKNVIHLVLFLISQCAKKVIFYPRNSKELPDKILWVIIANIIYVYREKILFRVGEDEI
jgi:hypothetical protein